MTTKGRAETIEATCHCGAVTIQLPAAPQEITHCNCSLCRRLGVLWAYYEIAEASLPAADLTDTYAWGGKNVDFHRCRTCGCLTHWYPRDKRRTGFGLNARLIVPTLLEKAQRRYKDSAGTGLFH